MKEYIEREALLQDIKETVVYTARPDRENLIGRGVRLVLDRISAAPTADVAPVVHGEWELHGNDDNLGSSYWCSCCHANYDEDWFYDGWLGEFKPFKICPNCGAKMDGGKQDGNL